MTPHFSKEKTLTFGSRGNPNNWSDHKKEVVRKKHDLEPSAFGLNIPTLKTQKNGCDPRLYKEALSNFREPYNMSYLPVGEIIRRRKADEAISSIANSSARCFRLNAIHIV